jgi:hypothetical protein
MWMDKLIEIGLRFLCENMTYLSHYYLIFLWVLMISWVLTLIS